MPKTRSRHGLTALKSRVMVRGLSSIDMRTVAAQELVLWKQSLIRDLGGEESISSQKLALVDLCVRTKLFVDHLDSFLVEQSSLVNKRRKSVIPALRERQGLADSLARLLAQLGLERALKPAQELTNYISGKKAGVSE